MKRSLTSSIVFFILVTSCVQAFGQAAPTEVSIKFSATDVENRPVKGLTKDDLILLIDGKEQVVESFEEKKVSPFSLIAVDTSGSMRQILPLIIDSAKTIVRENDHSDLSALMRFVGRDKIQISNKFTNDKDYLNSLLDRFVVEGGQTAVIDAIYSAAEVLKDQPNSSVDRRKTLVVISDGEDRDSKHNEEELIALLSEADVRVCFLGVVFGLSEDGGFGGRGPRQKSLDFINKVSRITGGFAINPKKPDQLAEAAKQLSQGMRSQMVLRFQHVSKRDAKVEIKLSKKSKFRDLRFFIPERLRPAMSK